MSFHSHRFLKAPQAQCPHKLCQSLSLCNPVTQTLQPHGLWPARLLCPRDFPGKNTGVGCHIYLQWIFQPRDWTHISCISCIGRQILSPLSHHWCWGAMGLPPCCKHKGEIISFFTEQQEDGLSQTLSVGNGGGVGGAEFITTKWPHSRYSVPKKHSQCTTEKENPSGQECKVVLAWQSLQALRKTLKFRPARSPTEKTPRNLNSWSITTTLIRSVGWELTGKDRLQNQNHKGHTGWSDKYQDKVCQAAK